MQSNTSRWSRQRPCHSSKAWKGMELGIHSKRLERYWTLSTKQTTSLRCTAFLRCWASTTSSGTTWARGNPSWPGSRQQCWSWRASTALSTHSSCTLMSIAWIFRKWTNFRRPCSTLARTTAKSSSTSTTCSCTCSRRYFRRHRQRNNVKQCNWGCQKPRLSLSNGHLTISSTSSPWPTLRANSSARSSTWVSWRIKGRTLSTWTSPCWRTWAEQGTYCPQSISSESRTSFPAWGNSRSSWSCRSYTRRSKAWKRSLTRHKSPSFSSSWN